MRVWFDELALLWRQFTWRHWCAAPWKTLLLTGILALGVAVFFSIRLANRAAVAGFVHRLRVAVGQLVSGAPLPEAVPRCCYALQASG